MSLLTIFLLYLSLLFSLLILISGGLDIPCRQFPDLIYIQKAASVQHTPVLPCDFKNRRSITSSHFRFNPAQMSKLC